MGQILEVRCRRCAATSTQLGGPIMAGYLPRCVQCGRDRLVSWPEVSGPDPEGHDLTSAEVLDAQDARIQELAGTCKCGGTFAVDASVRCRKCRSADVEVTVAGIAD